MSLSPKEHLDKKLNSKEHMEQFEEGENYKKGKKVERKKYQYNNKNILCLIILFSFLTILYFLFLNHFFPKEFKNSTSKKEIKSQDNKSTIPNSNDLYSIASFESNPHLHTEFIFNLLNNYNEINLTNFERNLKIIVQKIYNIINNKKDNEDYYKILSTIYGAFLADSMGSFCEFTPFNKNNHLKIFSKDNSNIFKPGQVTDDSEMAMSLAYGVMDNAKINELNENLIYYYYLIWLSSNPLDIGITTRKALNIIKLDKNNNIKSNIFTEKIKNKIDELSHDSLANGFLMRISPFLCWFYMLNRNYIKEILKTKECDKYYELYSKILFQIEKDSQLTHPNRENAVSGAIFTFMGLCAMEQKYSGKEILSMVEILLSNNIFDTKKEEKILKNHFIKIMSEIRKEDFNEDIYFGNLNHLMGYYLHSFKLTLYYLYHIDEMKNNINIKEIYNKIIFSICDFGGDTDTNAAIVGMILGPLIGIQNFDDKYLNTFLNFYSKKRIIYTNAFIYFYAKYLIEINNRNPNDKVKFGEKINFNFYKMVYDFLFKKL